MKFRPTKRSGSCLRRAAAFTLAEVLAALVFMGIVIPTAVQGLHIANMAGQLGQRKAAAARVGERTLNELLVTRQWQTGSQNGVVQDGVISYRWMIRTEPWPELSTLRLLTVIVNFPVQGRECEIRLSTVVDPSTP
jgi:hypothetical protein